MLREDSISTVENTRWPLGDDVATSIYIMPKQSLEIVKSLEDHVNRVPKRSNGAIVPRCFNCSLRCRSL